MITILGTGRLGSGFARALRRGGHEVRAWNRTIARAEPLAADGISIVTDAAEAVRGAERVHVVVSDDAAVDAVLAAAAPGLAPGAFVLDHSTTSTAGALERTARWRAQGIAYLHAPVFMGPQNALESTGLILVSGDREVVARATPLLTSMTGKLVDLGPRVDRAAAFKLVGNLLLMAFAAGFSDMIALGRAMSLAPEEVRQLFDVFNPGASLPARYQRMIDAAYDQPSWDLAMARKDARLMLAAAASGGRELRMLPALVEQMDTMIARGFGEADWTVVAKDLVKPDGGA
jgi:3-hydroxyisobutyrate dehydrogenase